MRSLNFVEQFKVDTSSLSKNELEVLGRLVEAAKLLAKVYQLQLNTKNEPNFYPKDATRAEIEKVARHDRQILSPYTVVERDKNGKLMVIPYHLKYKGLLTEVAKKLEEAAEISQNLEFGRALKIQAQALLMGEYDKAQITWVKIKPYLLDIAIGPLERDSDQLFFIKRSYQAWVGIMDKNQTERATDFKNAVFATRRKILIPSEKVDFMDKAQIRVDDTVILAGDIAKSQFTATTLPNDIEILEKYGSEATIFLPVVKTVFSQKHYPIFKAIFAAKFRQSFTEDDLFRGYLYTVMLHEIARVLIRYRFAVARLREMFPIFNELTVEAAAIKAGGSLLLKDVVSQKEMESMLVMFLTRLFDYYFEMKDNPTIKPYVLGNAILLNSLLSSGALKLTKDGISWPNFTKMFIATANLADQIERILAEGNYKDAKYILKRYSYLSAFKKFKLSLTNLGQRE